ncbi:MAG: hypothetical protein IID36_00165 [Planctomycetes bacterium]|nr:hypothetical protein [Planctomycetota bacterium]
MRLGIRFTVGIVVAVAGLFVACSERRSGMEVDGPALPVSRSAEIAPPPFSAAQIREATRVGRTYRFRIEGPDAPTGYRRMRFTSVTDEGCTMEVTSLDLNDSSLGEPRVAQYSWDELVQHAAWPKAATEITDVDIETPLGKKACWLYTVRETRDGSDVVTRAWFATDLPGAPVRLEVKQDGEPVSKMLLVEHIHGE